MSPAGSHKPNTAVAQAYYNKQEKVARLSTETGAGQWGSALSQACSFFGLQCKVYMVKVSYQQKPYRRILMETFGAQVVASPSPDTQAGKKVLEQDPDSPGSLGIAISEAVEDAATRDDTKYSLGSVLNHVLMHQTVIGLETKKQLEKADDDADIAHRAASAAARTSRASRSRSRGKLTGKNKKRRIIAVEPSACPSLTKGKYVYDFGDTVGLTPLVKMHTLGHTFVPRRCMPAGSAITAWRRSSASSTTRASSRRARCRRSPRSRPRSSSRARRASSPLPRRRMPFAAPSTKRCSARRKARGRPIVFNLSGHGFLDLSAYEAYLAGKLQDYEYPAEKVAEALRHLPKVKA